MQRRNTYYLALYRKTFAVPATGNGELRQNCKLKNDTVTDYGGGEQGRKWEGRPLGWIRDCCRFRSGGLTLFTPL